jgi:hydrophobic/amphiphilic exporter-1 (mainly G- bacteria), HAE1 family
MNKIEVPRTRRRMPFDGQSRYKHPGANVIDTVPRLIRNIPQGIEVEVAQDRTGTIRASVRDVEITLALTVILVVIVILLFLRNFWATVIPAITLALRTASSLPPVQRR